ncbi:cupin [Afipia sp. P52-10]|uniref:cupin domain-containing protein n=1 Tax=Afipia sp. P52-10 TaxID=1429916 RepID=UPI0003DF1D21|nr:cupin domain-containing protein [Afipia sp. P52-10]ETR75431.1 cupin [Afipia sp. P52-10]
MTKPIVNLADIELMPRPPEYAATGPAAQRYDAKMGHIGARIGARQLGYNITAVPPGMRAFPFHNHRANEEMFFVLAGTGEVRIGLDTFPIRPGDFIACPVGGSDTAHQIINTGTEELRYLAVSTQLSPDHVEYPDTGKFGILAKYPPGTDGKPQMFAFIGREDEITDYWEGE